MARLVRAYRYVGGSANYQTDETRNAFFAALPGPEVQLSPFETALREAALAIKGGVPEGELVALGRMQQIAPRSVFRGYYFGALQDRNRPREALEQLEQLGPFGRDPNAPAGSPLSESGDHWRTVAALQHYVGDHEAERFAAERAATLTGTNVRTLALRGVAYAALGDSVAVASVVDAADVVNSEPVPNQFGGDVLLTIAQELEVHGQPAYGRQVLARALRWFERHRSETWPGETTPRTDIAFREVLALRAAGQDSAALERARPLASLDVEDTRVRSFYGRVQAALGNQAAADSVDAWLAVVQRNPAVTATALNERAFLAAARGRREEAVALLRESFARGNVFFIRRNLHRFQEWIPFRGYAPFDALITPAG